MPKERIALTEPLLAEIVQRIEAGAYPHVAAEACGVPAEVFTDWLSRHGRPGKRPPKPIFKKLAQAIRQAQGRARCQAEMAMLSDDAKTWLLSGPGKDADGRPGWSVPARPVVQTSNTDNRTVNVLLDPHLQNLFAGILEVLSPFPEARQAVARAILERRSGQSPTMLPHTQQSPPVSGPCQG